MKIVTHTNPDGSTVKVTLGDGVKLGDRVKLGDWVTLGNLVKLGDGVKLGDRVTLGNWVKLGDRVTLGDGVKLGDGVLSDNAWSMQPTGSPWPVCIMRDSGLVAIGCEQHPVDFWRRVDCDQLLSMGEKQAVKLWEKYGALVLAAYDAS